MARISLGNMVEIMIDRQATLDDLRAKEMVVHFTKKNGEERIMTCTLRPDFIPQDSMPKGTTKKEPKPLAEQTSCSVYDVEAKGWRSFLWDNVTEIKDIDTAIREYESNMNRSQIIQGDNYKVYLDAYNANPTSMKAAINNFKHSKAAKKTVILGDMFELGSESDLEHAALLKLVESSPEIDEAVLVGNHFMRQLKAHPKITFLETTMEAKEWFKQKDKEATLFLIKGSRGMALEKILE